MTMLILFILLIILVVLKLRYEPEFDTIFDINNRKMFIVWYNKDRNTREYKILFYFN